MRDLGALSLSIDPLAARFVKDEIVLAEFATAEGVIQSSVGLNHYRIGDALVTGANGDRWCVSRDRFDVKYRPCEGVRAGDDGRYRNVPTPVWAKQMSEAFSIERTAGGDRLIGRPGDWVLEYAPGDYGIVDQARFALVYRPLRSR
jgi:hypothetical protein